MGNDKQAFDDLWAIGPALAAEVGVTLEELSNAADRAAFPVVVLGCGSRVVFRADVRAWVDVTQDMARLGL